jgi:hypothetical protein
LAKKFRIYNKRIQAKPENVDHIILATCILHNFIKTFDANTYTCERTNANSNETAGEARLENPLIEGRNATRDAFV